MMIVPKSPDSNHRRRRHVRSTAHRQQLPSLTIDHAALIAGMAQSGPRQSAMGPCHCDYKLCWVEAPEEPTQSGTPSLSDSPLMGALSLRPGSHGNVAGNSQARRAAKPGWAWSCHSPPRQPERPRPRGAPRCVLPEHPSHGATRMMAFLFGELLGAQDFSSSLLALCREDPRFQVGPEAAAMPRAARNSGRQFHCSLCGEGRLRLGVWPEGRGRAREYSRCR